MGINRYKSKAIHGLSGCVADVRNMQGLLRGKFDFPDDSIRVVTDEQATHAAIVSAFKDHLIGRQVRPIPAKLDGWVTKIKTLEVIDKS